MKVSVPLAFHDPSRAASIDPETLVLPYRASPLSSTQARFRGRWTAEPAIDLSQYECRAVFDCVEIAVETRKDQISVNLHRTLMRLNDQHGGFFSCFVGGPDRRVFSRGRRFTIKFHDPNPVGFKHVLKAFAHEVCVEDAPEIPMVGFELSLDVYPAPSVYVTPEAYARARMVMTELLRKHIAINEVFRSGRRRARFTHAGPDGPEGSASTRYMLQSAGALSLALRQRGRRLGVPGHLLRPREPEAHHHPPIDSTMYVGDQQERLLYRIMDKVTDRRCGAHAEALAVTDTRSRIEFCLRDERPGDGLGPASICLGQAMDLGPQGLRFLNTLLLFELPTFTPGASEPAGPDPCEWQIFAKTGVGGLGHMQAAGLVMNGDRASRKAEAERAVMSPGLNRRFSALNRRVSGALTRLEKQWRPR